MLGILLINCMLPSDVRQCNCGQFSPANEKGKAVKKRYFPNKCRESSNKMKFLLNFVLFTCNINTGTSHTNNEKRNILFAANVPTKTFHYCLLLRTKKGCFLMSKFNFTKYYFPLSSFRTFRTIILKVRPI